jgi:lysophospholipase L1-like esterase
MILNWEPRVLASNIAARNPALIVLAYGTNEAGNKNWTEETYAAMLKQVIGRMREAAPAASILVIGPPDRYTRVRGKWTVYAAVDRIVVAEREAAISTGCAFLDLRSKMGEKGSMHTWVLAGLAQYDHVHFAGTGYKMLADSMFRDFLTQYGIFVKAREQ